MTSEGAVFGVFRTLLTNNDGFTAIEYGLIAAFTLIFCKSTRQPILIFRQGHSYRWMVL
jgi:hypothetical protein